MTIGFTGTRKGMTEAQKEAIRNILGEVVPQSVVHGDCIGADSDFHNLIRESYPLANITTYPSNLKGLRAFCKADEVMPERDPLERNKDIVNSSIILIATPDTRYERLRSGTWACIRYARKMLKSSSMLDSIVIVWPDGTYIVENRKEFE